MLTFDDIIGPHKDHEGITSDVEHAIRRALLPAAWSLERRMREAGIEFPLNVHTGASIAGSGYCGWRPLSACDDPDDPHAQGLAVDRYDPDGAIGAWCLRNQHVLEECGIWVLHPAAAPAGGCHWQCIGPRSKARVFRP